jgi:hypothetical protein
MKASVQILWQIKITEFYLSTYSIPGPSGVPPASGSNIPLAYMTIRGTPDVPNTPVELTFYLYFFPDGSNLDQSGANNQNGTASVRMNMNMCQLEGLVASLRGATNCTASYTFSPSGSDQTTGVATIIGSDDSPDCSLCPPATLKKAKRRKGR